MTPPPYSITQSNQRLNSGKPVLTVLRLIYRRKLRNSEMEETWRAKKQWSCGECSCPSEQNTLTSSPLVPTHELSECQNLWSFFFFFFYWGFHQQGYWLYHWAAMTDLNFSALPSHYRWRRFKPLNPLLILSANPFSIPDPSPWIILVPKKDKNSTVFSSLRPWTRTRMKYG